MNNKKKREYSWESAFLLPFSSNTLKQLELNMQKRFIESSLSKEDQIFETPLRPDRLKDFLGQEKIKERLEIFIQAAKQRKEALGHSLFLGPAGLGKTTLSHILANEMGTNMVVTSGPSIEKAGDLAGILTNLQVGDVLFIDEIHRLQRSVEEYLYSAMEDYRIDITIDSGPSARTIHLDLNPFTLVGATTRAGLLTQPLRSRFHISMRLDFYDAETLSEIVIRTGELLKIPMDRECALLIASRARGTPRVANNLVRWVRDYAQIKSQGMISVSVINQALKMLAIDVKGLDEMDKRILTTIIQNYQGGPVGLSTLAVALGEESNTLEEVYEPYLIMQGFLKRTPRGREATPLAYEHIGNNEGRKS